MVPKQRDTSGSRTTATLEQVIPRAAFEVAGIVDGKGIVKSKNYGSK